MLSLNISLIIVGVAIAVSIILGAVVFINDRRSITNITFLLFSLSAVLWNTCNYLFYQPGHSSLYALILLRLVVFFAIWYCFFLSQLFFVFPEKMIIFPKKYYRLILPFVTIISLITLTPFVFKNITSFDDIGRVATVLNGFGIYIFGATVISIILSGFYIIINKLIKTPQKSIERDKFVHILIGAIITFTLHIIFNMILPAFFNISQFTALGAVFTLPFSILTSYAIIKYRLFNVKIIETELITFALWLLLLVRALTSSSIQDQIIDGGLLIATIIIGIQLIRSVMKEVEQRERLEVLRLKLEDTNLKLEVANDKLKDLDKLKTEFLSLASHQLRSPLTTIKGYTSMILEGDFGEVNDKAKDAVERVFQSTVNLTKVVEDLLNVSKIEQGGMKYEMTQFNLSDISRDMSKDLAIVANKKGLKLTFESNNDTDCIVNADKEKIRQVVLNLIDNSIKYTKEGTIDVSVRRIKDKVVFAVKDTGMGMTPEIKTTLFQKFSRGDGARMNTSGSGLGLYLAKEIIEAHKGTVGVDSEGMGKGSTFHFELRVIM